LDYFAPETLADACRALDSEGAQCLAGGQSLVAMMNVGLATPERIVSLRRVPELRGIDVESDGALRIGAMTTHAELAALSAGAPGARLLAQTARVVAYPAVRTLGTIGGSIALADPAADYPVALVAIDAIVEIASTTGTRRISARKFFRGMFDTALVRGEIVTAIHIPSGPANAGTAYEKLSLVAGDFAIVSAAAIVGNGVRVAVGGCAMKPILLAGLDASADAFVTAARELASQSDPPSDHRASAAYRRRVAPEIVRRALRAAAASVPS
jgi:carbon-monoxide dehydrogenase medium subunit